MPAPYTLHDERLEEEWNRAWKFIDSLDLVDYVWSYTNIKGPIDKLYDFMEYVEYKSGWTSKKYLSLFNCISEGDFEEYLYQNYRDKFRFETKTILKIRLDD